MADIKISETVTTIKLVSASVLDKVITVEKTKVGNNVRLLMSGAGFSPHATVTVQDLRDIAQAFSTLASKVE